MDRHGVPFKCQNDHFYTSPLPFLPLPPSLHQHLHDHPPQPFWPESGAVRRSIWLGLLCLSTVFKYSRPVHRDSNVVRLFRLFALPPSVAVLPESPLARVLVGGSMPWCLILGDPWTLRCVFLAQGCVVRNGFFRCDGVDDSSGVLTVVSPGVCESRVGGDLLAGS